MRILPYFLLLGAALYAQQAEGDWIPIVPDMPVHERLLLMQASSANPTVRAMALADIRRRSEAGEITGHDRPTMAVIRQLGLEGSAVIARGHSTRGSAAAVIDIRRESAALLRMLQGPYAASIAREMLRVESNELVLAEIVRSLGFIDPHPEDSWGPSVEAVLRRALSLQGADSLIFSCLVTIERLFERDAAINRPEIFRLVLAAYDGPWALDVRTTAARILAGMLEREKRHGF